MERFCNLFRGWKNHGWTLVAILLISVGIGQFANGLVITKLAWISTLVLFIVWNLNIARIEKLYDSSPYPSFDTSKKDDISYYIRFVNGQALNLRVEEAMMTGARLGTMMTVSFIFSAVSTASLYL